MSDSDENPNIASKAEQFQMGRSPVARDTPDEPPELLQATYPEGILPGLVAKATGQAYLPVDDPSLYPPPPPPPDDIASGEEDDPFAPPAQREAGEQAEYPPDILPMLVAKATDNADNPADDPSRYPPPPPPPSDTASGADPIEPAEPGPPGNVDVPYVNQDGDTLACTMGNWTGEPASYTYQWQLDGSDAGTDSDTLVVTSDDVGKTASCVVTATNDLGSTAAPPSNAVVIASFT